MLQTGARPCHREQVGWGADTCAVGRGWGSLYHCPEHILGFCQPGLCKGAIVWSSAEVGLGSLASLADAEQWQRLGENGAQKLNPATLPDQ